MDKNEGILNLDPRITQRTIVQHPVSQGTGISPLDVNQGPPKQERPTVQRKPSFGVGGQVDGNEIDGYLRKDQVNQATGNETMAPKGFSTIDSIDSVEHTGKNTVNVLKKTISSQSPKPIPQIEWIRESMNFQSNDVNNEMVKQLREDRYREKNRRLNNLREEMREATL